MGMSTGLGDQGETDIFSGRVRKSSHRVCVLASIDVLISWISIVRGYFLESGASGAEHVRIISELSEIDRYLGKICSEVAGFRTDSDWDRATRELEQCIRLYDIGIKGFTDYSKVSEGRRLLNFCRALCRRAECDLWCMIDEGLHGEDVQLSGVACYINRLSDYFAAKII